MKKNILRKFFAMTLVGALAVGTMAGCGDEEATGNNSGSNTSGSNSSAQSGGNSSTGNSSAGNASTGGDTSGDSATQVAGMEGWEPFAENVTLKIPVYDRGQEGIPAIGENYWEDWVQENFADNYNITMEFVPITRSDVMTSYSLLASDQDLPTVLMEYDFPKMAQWADDGYLATYDLNAFAQVAPTYYNRMVELGQLNYTDLNGECYFVLAERQYYNVDYTWVTMYRQDWAEQVGYTEYPQTWEEQKDMLTKIKEAGLCEYPLGGKMVTGAGVDTNYEFRTFPLDEKNWAMYGDYNIPAMGDAANKAFLKRENEKYNLGFTNPEYYVTDEASAKARFVNGETFEYSGFISAEMDWLTAFYEQNPDADLAVKVIKDADTAGGTVPAFRSNNPYGMMIGFSSMASEDEIKAAWMYMEWLTQEDNLFTMQWGNEGEHYTLDANGLPVSVGGYSGDKVQGYNNSKDYWCITVEARTAGTIEDVIAANAPAGLPEDFAQQIIDQYYIKLENAEKGYSVPDCAFAVIIDSISEYQTTLLEDYTVLRDRVTMCAPEDFEAEYEKAAKEYADAGYQAIVDERAEAYEAGMCTTLQ